MKLNPEAPFQEGDADSLGDDVRFDIWQDKMNADRNAHVRVIRWLSFFLLIAVAGIVLLGVGAYKTQQSWAHYRYPFVWANAQGTPVLVTNAESSQAYNDISDVVVKQEVRAFLDARFGVSPYHARQVWPSFMTYWLSPVQAKTFKDEAAKNLDALLKDNMWRRVQVRFISLDKRTPIEGGGTRYDATVEFLTNDLKQEDVTPKRTYWWRMRMAFSLGTPFGLTDPNAIQAAGTENPLDFRLLEYYAPVPVEVPMDEQIGTIQSTTDLLGQTGPTGAAQQTLNSPLAPQAQPVPSTQQGR